MKLDQKTLNEILEQVKPSLIDGLKQELQSGITYEVKQAVAEQVRDHITKWIQVEVLPEITKNLIESKEGFIALGPRIGEEALESLALSFTKSLKDNLNNSWSRKEIFKALFDI